MKSRNVIAVSAIVAVSCLAVIGDEPADDPR